MAHFARIVDGVVMDVVVISNDVITVDGAESEKAGQDFLTGLLGGEWVQCSYNANPIAGKDRGPYPGPGFLWDGKKFSQPDYAI
jgi:hypothetical protein